jgi:aquaporin Z
LWAGGRFEGKDLLPYLISQTLGALCGAAILMVIVTGNGSQIGDFAANGYGEHSPGGYNATAAFITELVMTFIFLVIILGSTYPTAPFGFAGIAIGFGLTLIHLISIPVTNTSVNPARSISQAVFVGGWAVEQLWLFIVAPAAGALLAGIFYKTVLARE